ncbi:MAG: hypothetical protein US49_C0001G0153 [candidate division TM6 bacterium GW2011_GWF2_37_49]|nr:MAG: hypothetical protein US49_C0001G0153 [candidate division TM6 bacterium GW2011_GWF2_37_49]
MKVVTQAILLSVFVSISANADVQNRHDRAHASRHARHVSSRSLHHRRKFMSDPETSVALDNLAKDTYSVKKLADLRLLLMKSRGISASEQTKAKFNTLLQEACNNYNKGDRREAFTLRSVLILSQRSTLLSQNNQQYVDKILADIGNNSVEEGNRQLNIANLNSVSAKDNYSAKAMSLCRIMRRPNRGIKFDKNMQSEASSAIHDLYANRPLNDVALLSKLKEVLNLASQTPLLSTINQYEVKEIMLPEVLKNVDKAALLTKNSAEARTNQAPCVKCINEHNLAKMEAGESVSI